MSFTAFNRYLEVTGHHALVQDGPWAQDQQGDYESGIVQIDGELWWLRTARVTPTKPGAFVAFWERNEHGATQPFAVDESAVGLLVFVADQDRFGVFRFPAEELARLGITRSASQPGKRGFRLYPPWCSDLNPQALRTQRVQARSFTLLE